MRLIGELKDQVQAQKFAAYLMTEGITPDVEEENGVWEVWVKDEDKLEQAVKEIEAFQADPNADRYSGVLQKAEEIFRKQEVKRQQYQKNLVDVSKKRSGSKIGPLTMLLIIASVIAYVFTGFGAGFDEGLAKYPAYRALSFTAVEEPEASELVAKYDSDNLNVRLASIKNWEIWRLVTPIFIHFSPMHIIFNMIWLYQLGNLIENRYGTFWLAMLVLASAAISNFVQSTVPLWMDGSAPALAGDVLIGLSGGMSGVVYGLFGFVWMKSVYDRSCGFRINEVTVFIMLGWLVLCMTGLMGSIGNWAHAIGLIVGMIAGYAPTMMRR